MREEDKDILTVKMLDAPSALTDDEIDAIIQDEELRGIYEMSSDLVRACAERAPVNVADEWKRFSRKLPNRPSMFRRSVRAAAVFAAILMAAGMAFNLNWTWRAPEAGMSAQSKRRGRKLNAGRMHGRSVRTEARTG